MECGGDFLTKLLITLGSEAAYDILESIVEELEDYERWALTRTNKFLFDCMMRQKHIGGGGRKYQAPDGFVAMGALKWLEFLHKERLLVPSSIHSKVSDPKKAFDIGMWLVNSMICTPEEIGEWALEHNYLDLIEHFIRCDWLSSSQAILYTKSKEALDLIWTISKHGRKWESFDFVDFFYSYPRDYEVQWHPLLELTNQYSLDDCLTYITIERTNLYIVKQLIACYIRKAAFNDVLIEDCDALDDNVRILIPPLNCVCKNTARHNPDIQIPFSIRYLENNKKRKV